MNTQMWQHKATQRNIKQIQMDGAVVIEPGEGMLACGEVGAGRMAEVDVIIERIMSSLRGETATKQSSIGSPRPKGLAMTGLTALVTSGPTHEAIDPVRYIANRSSGKQGHAIAIALAELGADVTLVTGPTTLTDPLGMKVVHVTSADEMLKACEATLPVQVAVCAAAIGDWRVSQPSARKLKKTQGTAIHELQLIENPDILAHIAQHPKRRPTLVIGFAAETDDVLKNATAKRKRKGCDWILANDVSAGKGFNADDNEVTLISDSGEEHWPLMGKEAIAKELAIHIQQFMDKTP
jgi:phosphopantothenoylcysteine decarboxylase/phosphopantothenate--cysteine ligase